MNSLVIQGREDTDNSDKLDALADNLVCGPLDLGRVERRDLSPINLKAAVKVVMRSLDYVSQCVWEVAERRNLSPAL